MKENTEITVECKANSSNPVRSVGMEFLIDGKQQRYNKHQETKTLGSNNGMVKSFAFTFTTNRSQNGKIAKCCLQWDGEYINMTEEAQLNIRCKQCFLHDSLELDFKEINVKTIYLLIKVKQFSSMKDFYSKDLKKVYVFS